MLKKAFVIAKREYLAAVRTKSFVASIILLPVMMTGGIVMQKVTEKMGDSSTYKVAVIDNTEGQQVLPALLGAVTARNANLADDKGKQTKPRYELETITPPDAASLDNTRLELSKRVESKELLAFIEIGRDILKPADLSALTSAATQAARDNPGGLSDMSMEKLMMMQEEASKKIPDEAKVRYSTNRPTNTAFPTFLRSSLMQIVAPKRLSGTNISFIQLASAMAPPTVDTQGLATRDAEGKVAFNSRDANIFAAFIVPMVLLALMFLVVLVGVSPLTMNTVEEKQNRISEVLLGSVSPFQLMLGKLVGGVGVAMTLGAVYIVGGLFIAKQMNFIQFMDKSLLVWFFVFVLMSALMLGSLFIGSGAAASTLKEAQAFITPIMFVAVVPFMFIQQIISQPSGTLAKVLSFMPLMSPGVMITRMAIPPGVAQWEKLLATGVSLLTTIILVWIGGRVFRLGILLQGRPASMKELAKWIVRG